MSEEALNEIAFSGNIDLSKGAKVPKQMTFAIDREDVDFEIDDLAAAGGMSVFPYESAGVVSHEKKELIRTYRAISTHSEIDMAIQEIKNEIFIFDIPDKRAVSIDFFPQAKMTDSLKKKIENAFNEIYDNVLNFDVTGEYLFGNWYVDGELILLKGIEGKKLKTVTRLDPMNVSKVRSVPRRNGAGEFNVGEVKEFFIYKRNVDNGQQSDWIQSVDWGDITSREITKDTLVHVTSNYFDPELGHHTSWLKKTIVPFNNLQMLENAAIIFRVARAPTRRVIYVDTSNMQKQKAEQYMKEMQARFKNKMVFNSKTGGLSDRRNLLSMLEDYWLPRRDGGKGTEVSNIDGQPAQEIMEEVSYFKTKLWQSLNVPISRFSEETTNFLFGRGVEIQRDEYRFKKFINRLRQQFMGVFRDLLKTKLILENVCNESDWIEIDRYIHWHFAEDNSYVEYKEAEILNSRLETLQRMENYIGKFYSVEWVKKNVLKQTDEEIEEIEKQNKEEPFTPPNQDGGNDFGQEDGIEPEEKPRITPPVEKEKEKEDED